MIYGIATHRKDILIDSRFRGNDIKDRGMTQKDHKNEIKDHKNDIKVTLYIFLFD